MEPNNLDNIQNNIHQPSLNILADNSIQVNEQFVIKLTKKSKNVTKNLKESCKILHLSSEWNFDEQLDILNGLNPKEYPNLFIFILNIKNVKLRENFHENNQAYWKRLNDNLLKFGKTRPLILQLTSEEERVTQFYHKEENSELFFIIDQHQRNFEENKNFPTFLCKFLSHGFENFYTEMINLLPNLQNSLFILRFLMTLKIEKIFFEWLILKTVEEKCIAKLYALLDISFENGGRVISSRSKNYLSTLMIEHDHLEEQLNINNEENSSSSESKESEDEEFPPEPCTSILLKAVEHENKDVIEYLIQYWTPLIQQLPFDHQIQISTEAFEKNQIDVFCDLLEVSDFPFPNNLKVDEQIKYERVRKIITERTSFSLMVEEDDFKGIDEFIDRNLNLKFVYNTDNIPALVHAANLKKFKVFYYLKSFGFQGINCEDALEDLNEKQRKQALEQAYKQRKSNVNESLPNENKSAYQLFMRSFIHNRKITKEQDNEYRKYILEWFLQIYKIAPEIINVAASCENLKIIFDFESETVENASLSGPQSLGSTYPISKWIFVGAKLLDKKQQIKGVLAHELCHYVMRLVYENNENPYYQYSDQIAGWFTTIVQQIIKLLLENTDDECNGIISSVFELYLAEEFHLELIVRVVQILAEFDDNPEKSKDLQHKYRQLFGFWDTHVIPELNSFCLQTRNLVKKMNKSFKLLENFERKKVELSVLQNQNFVNNKLIVVLTNVPKLLLINIYQQLQKDVGNQLNAQNIFVDPEKLNAMGTLNEFKELITTNPKLNIFIDCSKLIPKYLKDIVNTESNMIFVVSNGTQKNEIAKLMQKKSIKPKNCEMNYKWCFLTKESQINLIKTKINYQGRHLTLMDLFKKDMNPNEPENDQNEIYLEHFTEIIDDKLLNLLVDGSEISIRPNSINDPNESNLELLFKQRKLKKQRCSELTDEELYNRQPANQIEEISQEDLLSKVKEEKYILLSDKAGNGKSWMMINIAKVLREQNPTRWIVYVDLKKYIDVLKVEPTKPDFLSFMLDKVIKPENKLEEKIFTELYKIGKVSIIFDGYDEIAPNCSDFVKDLGRKLEFNGGNQLWIAARDFFEDELKNNFQLKFVYKLVEFNGEHGINLIVASWVLDDLATIGNITSREYFDDCVKNSLNYQEYEQFAQKIVEKISLSENRSLRFPLFFKMIADGFRKDKDPKNVSISTVFENFVQSLFTRWSLEKGKIRQQAFRNGLPFNINFWGIHEFWAIKTMFPHLIKDLFPNFDGTFWIEIEIIACGLMSKIDGIFYFIHETLRDYFIAHKLANSFRRNEINANIVNQFIEILIDNRFHVIRMFLNDYVKGFIIPEIHQMQLSENICNAQNFKIIFTNLENLENLADFVISVLRTKEYIEVKCTLKESINYIIINSSNSKVFEKLQDYLFESLNVIDLQDFLCQKNIFQEIIASSLDIETFVKLVVKTERKFSSDLVKNILVQNEFETQTNRNIFYYLCKSPNLSAENFRKCIIVMRKYFNDPEILNLLKNCNDGDNILQTSVKIGSASNLKVIWPEIENLITTQYHDETFINFVKHQNEFNNNNILHCASESLNIENHKVLWEFLPKVIDRELKEFILHKNKDDNNFVHKLISVNQNSAIAELTVENLKNICVQMSKSEAIESNKKLSMCEILDSVGQMNRNLLLSAAYNSKNVEVVKLVWKLFRVAYESNNVFLNFLQQTDENGKNVFNILAEKSTKTVLEFFVKELENINVSNGINRLLSNLDNQKRNVLQSAALGNKSLELHDCLKNIFGRYFTKSEIEQYILHTDSQKQNVLCIAISNNTVEIVKTIWDLIETVYDHDNKQIKRFLKNNCEKLIKAIQINTCDKENVQICILELMDKYKIKGFGMIDSVIATSAIIFFAALLGIILRNK